MNQRLPSSPHEPVVGGREEQSDREAGAAFARAFVQSHRRAPSEKDTAVAWGELYVEAMEEGLLSAIVPLSPQEDEACRSIVTREAVDSLRERIERYGSVLKDPSYQEFRAGALAAQGQEQATDNDASPAVGGEGKPASGEQRGA